MQLKQLLEADNDKIPLDNNKGDKSVAEKTDTRKTRLTLCLLYTSPSPRDS